VLDRKKKSGTSAAKAVPLSKADFSKFEDLSKTDFSKFKPN
jgi:hypothetical protein